MKKAKERVIYDSYEVEDYEDDYFDCELDELDKHFKGNRVFLEGVVQRWDGSRSGFQCFDSFKEAFYWATKDCGTFFRLWDENGHLYLTCSHHDGTNRFEVKVLTEKGSEYLHNWEYSQDKRTTSHIHEQLRKRYTKLPRVAEVVFGYKRYEWEEEK